LVSWKARPKPARVRRGAAHDVMSWPFSRTLPAVAGNWPEIRLK
jgi:hypothetical protein